MQVKNNTSGHNKVTHKFYDRLSELMGHRAISQPMANGVDSSLEQQNYSDLETTYSQNVIEERTIIEQDQPIGVIHSLPDNDNADFALTPRQTGKMPKVSIIPPRTAPYKKALKAFSKDIAEEAKQLQAEFFVEQEKLMNTFFTKQKKWEEVLEKEEARVVADRISNENIMKNLIAGIANQPQYPIQYPYYQNNGLYFNPTSADYSSENTQP